MIIWLASYPKSGNTWLRSIISTLIYTDDGIFDFNKLSYIPQFPRKIYFDEFTDKKDNFNELVLNGLRLSNGLNMDNLKNYKEFFNKNQLNQINKKWDCLSVDDENIKLTNKGFLFVDEITKEFFV